MIIILFNEHYLTDIAAAALADFALRAPLGACISGHISAIGVFVIGNCVYS